MAQNRTNASYGGVYVDEEPVTNPQTQVAANKFDRLIEDVAQGTRVWDKVDVKFQTTTTAAPVAVSVVACQTQWGTGSSYHPAIQKTATGTYVATFGTSYDDGLVGTAADDISETETIALEYAAGAVMSSSVLGHVVCTASANTITAYVYNSAGALSDLGGGVSVWLTAK